MSSTMIPLETAHNVHANLHQVFPDDGYADACLTKVGSGVQVETAS